MLKCIFFMKDEILYEIRLRIMNDVQRFLNVISPFSVPLLHYRDKLPIMISLDLQSTNVLLDKLS